MIRSCAVSILAAVTLAVQGVTPGEEPVDSIAVFERLKTLAGTWDAVEKGNPNFAETVTYTMTGRGTVLIEDMKAPTSTMGHMLTAYHLDGGRLVLTHFCGAGNQPRMRVKAVEDGNHITFEMYDITNLAAPDAYHSRKVDIVFLNNNRVDLVYQGAAGEKQFTQIFQLTRRINAMV